MTIAQINMRVRRWRWAIQTNAYHLSRVHSAETFDLGRKLGHALEVRVASLADEHTWTFKQPATWWQHLKADLATWLKSKSPIAELDNLAVGSKVCQLLWRVGLKVESTVRMVSQTKSAYVLYPTVPIPRNVQPEDVFCVFG